MPITIAVIGAGKWGMNHVRTLSSLSGGKLRYVVELGQDALKSVHKILPKVIVTDDLHTVLDSDVDSVIVVTPASSHYEIGRKCLEAGKHVLVEKPMALYSAHVKELCELAETRDLKLMVGHLLLFHPAIVKMKEIIAGGQVGDLQYIYSNRLNLGRLRQEENILWSFAPHDIAILDYFIGIEPEHVFSRGGAYVQSGVHDVTVTHLTYGENIQAHIHVSWLHPFKEHRLVVIGDKGMLVFEDNPQGGTLLFYDKGFDLVEGVPEKRDKGVREISLTKERPLENEIAHFVDCIENNKTPLVDGQHALRVMKVLERAQESLLNFKGGESS